MAQLTVNSAKSTVPCFFNTCYFHNVGFSTVVCPRCAPGIGGTLRKFGEYAKKKFPAFVPPNFKTVSAPMSLCKCVAPLVQ